MFGLFSIHQKIEIKEILLLNAWTCIQKNIKKRHKLNKRSVKCGLYDVRVE